MERNESLLFTKYLLIILLFLSVPSLFGDPLDSEDGEWIQQGLHFVFVPSEDEEEGEGGDDGEGNQITVTDEELRLQGQQKQGDEIILENSVIGLSGVPEDVVELQHDPINPVTGEYALEYTDFHVDSPGIDFQLYRTYTTFFSSGTELGKKWWHNYEKRLVMNWDYSMMVRNRTGFPRVYNYNCSEVSTVNSYDGDWLINVDLSEIDYTSSEWNTNTLERNHDGTYTERTKEGVEYTYKGYYAGWREEGSMDSWFSSGVPSQPKNAGRLLSIKDPNGNGLTFAYNDDGSIHKVTDAAGREYRFVYENGLLTQVRGPENMRVQYFYNGTGNLRRVVGAAGESREYFYDEQERISSFINPLGKEVRFQHDSEGRVTRVELGDGREFNRFTYNFTDTRRVTTAVDERGTEWTYEYDEKGRMLQERRAGSDPVRYEYNDPENPYDYTMRRDAAGRVWRYEYDQRRNITKVIEPVGVEKRFEWEAERNRLVSMFDGRGTWSWTYDPHGNLLLREDPAGRTARFEGYNQWGKPQVIIDGAGEATVLGYDSWGNVSSIEVPGKGITEISYDAAGRERRVERSGMDPVIYNWAPSNDELSVIDAAGAEHFYRFNALGQLTLYRDPRGGLHEREYNRLGYLTTYIAPSGAKHRWTRNKAGDAVEYIPPEGGKIVMEYNQTGQLYERSAPGDRSTAYRYDDAGRLRKVIDPENGITRYEYDPNGSVEKVRGPGDVTVRYEYDERGYIKRAYDPLGRAVSWERDGSGLITQVTDIEGTTYYDYDGAGRLREKIDIAGRSTTYEYKASDLVRDVRYPDERVEFLYDEAGRMTEARDPDMSERFSYDRAGRVRAVYFVEAGKRVEYEYTQRGEISRIIDPEGRSLRYERDNMGRVSTFNGPENVSASFTYDDLSRPLTAVYGNGTSAQWNWNSAGTMDSYSWQSPAGRIFVREYVYDKLDRITERREAGYEWHYAYNSAGMLRQARYPRTLIENARAWQDGQFPPGHAARYQDIYSGVPTSTKPGGMPPGQGNKPGTGEAWDEQPMFPDIVSTERWEYDAAANITERRRDEVSESFHYSGLNRLVQAGAVSYEYNRTGEMTEKSAPEGAAEYQWNGRGELVKAELSDGSTVRYGYDAFGRLVSRVKTPADGEVPPTAERSVYIWNQRKILGEYDQSAGGSLELYKQYFRAAGRLVAVKMYGFHGRREPGPEGFLHTKGGLMYYHSGRLGSPVAITDRHGEPVARYTWDAYGRAMTGVFDPYNTVGLTGKQLDGATGLVYFGARWYDADSGRFMSRDPIRDGWNWYAYVGGDPVNYVDAWGHNPTKPTQSDNLLIEGNTLLTLGEGVTGSATNQLEGKLQGRAGMDRNQYGYPKGIGFSQTASSLRKTTNAIGKLAVGLAFADIVRETTANGIVEGTKRTVRHGIAFTSGMVGGAAAAATVYTAPFAPLAGATTAIIVDHVVFGGTDW